MMATNEHRGRHSALPYLRMVLTLISSLTQEGDQIDSNEVACRLHISQDEAAYLVDSLSMLVLPDGSQLALAESEPDSGVVELIEGAGIKGQQIRLTKAETYALKEAFRRVGVQSHDPLNILLQGVATSKDDAQEAARLLAGPAQTPDKQLLELCVQAAVFGRQLQMDYQGISDKQARRRLVEPLAIQHAHGRWYVQAFDLERQQIRLFRFDRMSHACIEENTTTEDCVPAALPSSEATQVELVFHRRWPLELFEWHGLEQLRRSGESTWVKLPDYGGDWLPAHLAACGSAVDMRDENLKARLKSHAEHLLELAQRYDNTTRSETTKR